MAQSQAELILPPPRDETEETPQEREDRLWQVTLRYAAEAADEIGREQVSEECNITESTLSKQVREVDGRNLHGKQLQYLIKHQKSGRLARWVLSDYAKFLPPQRPERLKPEDFVRQIVAMAVAGEFGAGERQKVLALYGLVERTP